MAISSGKLLALAPVAVFLPAVAQGAEIYHASESWQVARNGAGCTASSTGVAEIGFGQLQISYDADRNEVTLASEENVKTAIPSGASVRLSLVFLDNGTEQHDDQWGARQFVHTATGGTHRFATSFLGERNTRQILGDLASSRRLGLLENGEVIFDHDLAGLRAAIVQLRECAAQPRS